MILAQTQPSYHIRKIAHRSGDGVLGGFARFRRGTSPAPELEEVTENEGACEDMLACEHGRKWPAKHRKRDKACLFTKGSSTPGRRKRRFDNLRWQGQKDNPKAPVAHRAERAEEHLAGSISSSVCRGTGLVRAQRASYAFTRAVHLA